MSLHAASPNVVRFPPRLRVVPAEVGKNHFGNADPVVARVETSLPDFPAATSLSFSPTVTLSPQQLRSVQKWDKTTSALDALLSAGTIDDRQHAAGLAWAAFHPRFEKVARTSWSGQVAALPTRAWKALKAERAALLAAAGFDRFLLDRLCLDGEAPLRCEVGRVRAALDRIAEGS